MPYPNQWQRLERQYGEPMETLLPRKANELGTLRAVAREFGVRYETIWKWGKRIGLSRTFQGELTPVQAAQHVADRLAVK